MHASFAKKSQIYGVTSAPIFEKAYKRGGESDIITDAIILRMDYCRQLVNAAAYKESKTRKIQKVT